MDSPLKHHFESAERPDCLDVSPERLNPMTAAQLERELEAALEAMTEEEYDPAVIDAYLDALDRKAPTPDHPDAGTAYAGFQARVQRAAGQVSGGRASRRSRVRLRTLLRVAAAAALLTTFLFSSMVVAQASGVDVFGAIARWTDSVFSFGALPGEDASGSVQTAAPAAQSSQTDRRDVPEESQTVQLELERRGLPLYYPKIPEDFAAEDPFLYIDPHTNCISFGTGYTKGDISISFGFDQFEHSPTGIYEKDDRAVELYECGGVTHYILGNLSSMTAAWINGPVEYCLAANLSSDEIKELIQSIYEE